MTSDLNLNLSSDQVVVVGLRSSFSHSDVARWEEPHVLTELKRSPKHGLLMKIGLAAHSATPVTRGFTCITQLFTQKFEIYHEFRDET